MTAKNTAITSIDLATQPSVSVQTLYINSAYIGKLAGSSDKNFALTRSCNDPTFPKPVNSDWGKTYWNLQAIEDWLPTYQRNTRIKKLVTRKQLDNALAMQFITRQVSR